MGVIENAFFAMIGLIVTIIVATISRLLADDAKAWLPKLTEKLIERAVSRLPQQEQERYSEEWRSDLNDTPGDISKLLKATGLLYAARKMANTLEIEVIAPIAERIIALFLLIVMAPLLVFTALIIFILDGRPLFVIKTRKCSNGKELSGIRFRTKAKHSPNTDAETTLFARVGHALRVSEIEEIPMLFDVVRGTDRLPPLLSFFTAVFGKK